MKYMKSKTSFKNSIARAGIAPDLIRLSVGIEDVEDILDDIRQALDKI